ncbi:MAG: hypothetical protein HY231_13895 [Acidobacteria bacterium]|nr:hypothetical protein [Acidobacteriota bacterium]
MTLEAAPCLFLGDQPLCHVCGESKAPALAELLGRTKSSDQEWLEKHRAEMFFIKLRLQKIQEQVNEPVATHLERLYGEESGRKSYTN